MSKIIFVIGLCGSGKSHLAKKISNEIGGFLLDEGFFIGDNINFNKNIKIVKNNILNGIDCVIVEASYCITGNRNLIIQLIKSELPHTEIEWVCIDNNLVQANKNIIFRSARNDKQDSEGHISINNSISQYYTYPEGAKIINTYKTA